MSRDTTNLTPVQRRIRAAAMAAGFSLDDVAVRVGARGYASKTLGRVGGEGDNAVPATHDRLQRIAEACGCPVEWLEHGWPALAPRVSGDPALMAAIDAAVEIKLAAALRAERSREHREPDDQAG